MNEITTIAESVLSYYNDLIKNNVIPGKAPVTLEWLRRQRIVEGRNKLDIRFGHKTVNSILGEKTPLAKAEQYLNEVRNNNKYELLPQIAKLIAEESNISLPANSSIKEKYSFLNEKITIQISQIDSSEICLSNALVGKILLISELEKITSLLKAVDSSRIVYFNKYFLVYISECAYLSLLVAFEEIKCIINAYSTPTL